MRRQMFVLLLVVFLFEVEEEMGRDGMEGVKI